MQSRKTSLGWKSVSGSECVAMNNYNLCSWSLIPQYMVDMMTQYWQIKPIFAIRWCLMWWSYRNDHYFCEDMSTKKTLAQLFYNNKKVKKKYFDLKVRPWITKWKSFWLKSFLSLLFQKYLLKNKIFIVSKIQKKNKYFIFQ